MKGSGGDLGSIAPAGSRAAAGDAAALEARFDGPADEDRMAGLYAHAAFEPGTRRASIDTPLHALLPFAHIDHVHPDAVIALAASAAARRPRQEIWGDAVGWTPWLRPGFELALRLQRRWCAHKPDLRGVIMAGHGLISWGEAPRPATPTPST